MAMTNINSRYEYLLEVQSLYWRARKHRDRLKLRSILDDAVEITGLNRKYLITKLGKRLKPYPTGLTRSDPRGRKSIYGSIQFQEALLTCWRTANEICAERLQPYLAELVPKLESCDELNVDTATRQLLLSASISTIARHLKRVKRRSYVPLGTTKPGTLLKSQIPVRKGLWNETEPGYLESDTVAHCGGDISGNFIHSYNFVDIATSWSEQTAVMGMGERVTVECFDKVKQRAPFRILGIDSDNGGEYINHHLWRYCKKNKLEFTRSRYCKKNDNAHVEQKNYTAIRKVVGYARLDTEEQLAIMNRLYDGSLRLYLNYFQPTRKRKSKEYDPSSGKARKFYFESKTPYQRLLEQPDNCLSPEQKAMLQSQYNNLNPVQLLAEIRSLLAELEKTLG
jgi:hypothetical protein